MFKTAFGVTPAYSNVSMLPISLFAYTILVGTPPITGSTYVFFTSAIKSVEQAAASIIFPLGCRKRTLKFCIEGAEAFPGPDGIELGGGALPAGLYGGGALEELGPGGGALFHVGGGTLTLFT